MEAFWFFFLKKICNTFLPILPLGNYQKSFLVPLVFKCNDFFQQFILLIFQSLDLREREERHSLDYDKRERKLTNNHFQMERLTILGVNVFHLTRIVSFRSFPRFVAQKSRSGLAFFFFPLRLIFIFSNKLNATLILDEIYKVPRMFF